MEEVTSYIPHRPPFLYVDQILELTDEKIVAKKDVSPDEPFFKGHYPEKPIMPGVLICEAIFQTGAILISSIMTGEKELEGIPVLTRITNAKFRSMVKPGDTLTLESTINEKLSNVYYLKGRALVDGKTAVTVEYACCLAKET